MVGWNERTPGKISKLGLAENPMKPSPVKTRASPPKRFSNKVDMRAESIGFLQTGLDSIKSGTKQIKENLKSRKLSLTAIPPISAFGELPGLKSISMFGNSSGPGSTSATGQSSQQGKFTRSGSSYGTSQSSYQTADENYYDIMKSRLESSFRWDSPSGTDQSSLPPNDNSTVGSSSRLGSSKKSSKQN
ncbi:unnamed protein product [Lathyrus oleraceus]